MAYLRNWGDIQAWMADNGICRWNISRTQAVQDNNNVFVFDKDKSEEENKLICERALERFAGDVLYLVGWRTKEAKTGGFSATILYEQAYRQPSQITPMQPQIGGLYGTATGIDIAGLTADIEQRISNRYEKERLERLEKELREEKRDLEAQKNSAMGIIAQTLAPFAKQLAGGKQMRNCAGTPLDAEEPVEAEPIRVKRTPEEPTATDNEVELEPVDGEPHEIEVFCTEKEYNRMMELMERFAQAEPEWLQLLETVTTLAESGDKAYMLAKGYLIN